MAASPAPSLDSIRGIESTFIEHNGYLSDSPLTLSGSSPPVSDSAICDDYPNSRVVGGTTSTVGGSQHLPISSSVSSSASSSSSSSSSCSSSSSSGLSGCGSTSSNASNGTSNKNSVGEPGVIGSGKGSPCGSLLANSSQTNSNCGSSSNNASTNNITSFSNGLGGSGGSWSRCTACKSKQSDAVAKCYDCLTFLCGSCVTAHEFMHCFNGHNIFLFKNFEMSSTVNSGGSNGGGGGGGGVVNGNGNCGGISGPGGTSINRSSTVVSGSSAAVDNSSATDFKLSNSFSMILQQQQQKFQQQDLQKQHQQQQQTHQQHQQPLTHLSKIVAAAAAAASSYSSHPTDLIGGELNQQQSNQTVDDLFSSMVSMPIRTQMLMTSQNQQQQQQQHQNQQQQQQQALHNITTFYCQRHKNEILKFSCRTCCTLVCKDCIAEDHVVESLHEIEPIQENGITTLLGGLCNNNNNKTAAVGAAGATIVQSSPEIILQSVIADLRSKAGEIVALVDNSTMPVNDSDILGNQKIKLQYQRTSTDINETYQFFCSLLEERKQELLKELENLYTSKMTAHTTSVQRSKDLVDKILQTCDTIERNPKSHSISDVLMLRKNLELQLHSVMQELQLPFELQFMSNYQSIQAGVRNTFGYIRVSSVEGSAGGLLLSKQPPIARPIQSLSCSTPSTHGDGSSNSSVTGGSHLPGGLGLPATLLENSYANAVTTSANGVGSVLMGRPSTLGNSSNTNNFDDLLTKRFTTATAAVVSTNGSNANSTAVAAALMSAHITNPYEKWSNGGSDMFTTSADPFSAAQILSTVGLTNGGGGSNANNAVVAAASSAFNTLNLNAAPNGVVSSTESLRDVTSKLLTASIYPPKSQIKRQKMIYHCKFGEFGVMEGQFTEPSGVAVNAQNDIIVADTNNHRIQIFDKEGRFKFQFGECGKRDSQLLYPNRVAVVRGTGDIIVTERSPTHQVQIYNQYGQFVRKFGADKLQHPRGVTVDNKGRIIVIECKVMRVVIFDQKGNMLHTFSCSQHLEFPNGVVVNDKQEIFISDNRSHCVKVFNYEGRYLRQIGGEGITNYPIGVGMNANGEILIADNHNNFNLTIFTQDGQLVSALESKVKHAQCFDVALMDDGSVVLANKDYRLYIYRYVQVPPVGL